MREYSDEVSEHRHIGQGRSSADVFPPFLGVRTLSSGSVPGAG